MTAPPELTVVMPVYNEQALVTLAVEGWLRALDALHVDYRVCVYDDGSKDETGALLRTLAGREPHLSVFTHANRGHGPTILRGYREARSPWVFQTDSDGEMPPDAFAGLWERREDFDFLLGSRQDRLETPARRLVTLVSRASVRVLFGAGIQDVNTPYRLMRRSCLQPLVEQLPDDTFAPNVLLSGMAVRTGLRIFETGVPHEGRRAGSGSLTNLRLWRSAVRSFAQTVTGRFSARR